MPFDLKSIKKAFDQFGVFGKSLSKILVKTPESLLKFADKVSK